MNSQQLWQHSQDLSKSKPDKIPSWSVDVLKKKNPLLAEDILLYTGCTGNWFLSEEKELVLFNVCSLVVSHAPVDDCIPIVQRQHEPNTLGSTIKWWNKIGLALMKRGWVCEVMGKICLKYNGWKFQRINKNIFLKRLKKQPNTEKLPD